MRRRFLLAAVPIAVALDMLPLYASESLLVANRQQLLYDFHSGFWMSLHHFLYELADARRSKARTDLPPKVIIRLNALLSQIDILSLRLRKVWNKALETYEKVWVRRDLLFDDTMFQIKLKLADHETDKSLARVLLPAELRQSLNLAAPIYRKYWWPEHDRINGQKANDLAKRVQTLGATLKTRLAMLYRSPWPSKEKLRVEMVPTPPPTRLSPSTRATIHVAKSG
jgi:hypothetical protein